MLTFVNAVLLGTLYDQLSILNDKYEVDSTLLHQQGLPYYASTWVISLLAWNLGMAATFTHLLLWNRDDLRKAWSWMNPTSIKKMWSNLDWRFWKDRSVHEIDEKLRESDPELDPHYRKMLAVRHILAIRYGSLRDIATVFQYPDAPNSWYFAVLLVSTIMACVSIYTSKSTLQWFEHLFEKFLSVHGFFWTGGVWPSPFSSPPYPSCSLAHFMPSRD